MSARHLRNPRRALRNGFTFFRALCILSIGLVVGTCPTLGEIFMRIDGVDGSSNAMDHESWIVVEHIGQSHIATGIAETSISAIVGVRKHIDAASPKLAEAAVNGQVFPEVDFEFTRSEGAFHRYFHVKLQNVSVLNHRVDVQSSGQSYEYASLLFEQIEWTYTERHTNDQPLANHKAYWDLIRNVGGWETERLAFVVRAKQSPDEGLRMEWMAEEGRTYELRATSDLGGTFESIQEIPPGEPGKRTLDLPTSKPFTFYYLTEKE